MHVRRSGVLLDIPPDPETGDGFWRSRIVDGDPEALREMGLPAIVTDSLVHVVTVNFEGDIVTVQDAAWPVPQRMDFEDDRRRYDGFAVVVEPGAR